MAPAAVPSAWQSDALPTELKGRWTMPIHKCTSEERREKRAEIEFSGLLKAAVFIENIWPLKAMT